MISVSANLHDTNNIQQHQTERALSVSKVFSHARITKQSFTDSTTISSTPLPLKSPALAMYPGLFGGEFEWCWGVWG